MNEIINKFLLVGDKFMPEMHLKQPGFMYSACGPFTKHPERIKKFKQTGNTSYIFKSELDKACFKHNSVYADYKDLLNRTPADKFLRDWAYEIASDNKYDGYQRGLASIVYKFFYKKTCSEVKRAERMQRASGVKRVDTKETNTELAYEFHKPIIKKFSKRKVYSSSAIDLFSKYAFVVPLENKRDASIVEGFKKIVNESNRQPHKIWVDQGSEFYNKVFKNWLKDKRIEMYSTYNEGKSVTAERFIRTLKNKLYKHMTAVGKNVYWDVLDDIVKKYNSTINKSIGMKPKDVGDDVRAEYVEESNEMSARFSVGDCVRISKFKNVFA